MKKKNELLTRAITGVVAVSIAIPAIVLSPFGIWLFCVIVSLVSFWEFMKGMLIEKGRYLWTALVGGMSVWILLLLDLFKVGGLEITSQSYQTIILSLLPVLAIVALFNKEEERPVETLGTIILGYVYVVLPLFLFYKISVPKGIESYNFAIPIGTLYLTWTLDVMAYTFGRIMGKHPLFPRVSPKKTWEGSIGGVIFCIGMGLLMDYFFPQEFSWTIISLIISIFSQLGDLVESMFKRSVKLKDSGKILPGHGGMLDRFDGMLISLPVIYLYVTCL
ncbi:MAG: phosphatidate cytidylyltransferase [Bacteroidia bacterium]|nr:phosphatidate cytidylyltransferase [Bacteroidia bacterium]